MKKLTLLLVILVTLSGPELLAKGEVVAQSSKADSVLRLLNNYKAQDSTKVDLMNEYAFQIRESDHDKAFQTASEAYALSKKLAYKKGMAYAYYTISREYSAFKVDNEKALKYALEALQIGEELQDKSIQSLANMIIGGSYSYTNDSIALQYYLKALTLAEEARNVRWITIALVNVGAKYINQRNYGLAKKYIDRAMLSAQSENDEISMVALYGQCGSIAMSIGNFKEAIEKYSEGINYAKKIGHYRGWAHNLSVIGNIYFFEIKDSAKAFQYLKQGIKVATEHQCKKELNDCHSTLAYIYHTLNNCQGELKYGDLVYAYKDSLQSAQSIQNMERMQEKLKLEKEKALAEKAKEAEDQRKYTQYAGLGIAIITILILFFLLSRSFIVKPKVVKIFGIIGLLITFEFFNLLLHPVLAASTNHSPTLMLLAMASIAGLLVPLHHWLEKWITTKLVEKNEKIRLAAAKRILEEAEAKERPQ